MAESGAPERRRGGREARRALRAAPMADAEKPVRPGLESGRFKPLSEADVVRDPPRRRSTCWRMSAWPTRSRSGVECLTRAGATLNDNGRLLFPRALVEDTLAKAARHFVLHGQDPRHDLEPWGKRSLFRHGGRRRPHGRSAHRATANRRSRTSTTSRASSTCWSTSTSSSAPSCRATSPTRSRWTSTPATPPCSGTTKHVGSSWVTAGARRSLARDAAPDRRWRETSGASVRSSASRTASSCRR